MPALPSKVKQEIVLAAGVAVSVAEILVAVFTGGALHDALLVAIPLATALGVRSQVIPVDKVIAALQAAKAARAAKPAKAAVKTTSKA